MQHFRISALQHSSICSSIATSVNESSPANLDVRLLAFMHTSSVPACIVPSFQLSRNPACQQLSIPAFSIPVTHLSSNPAIRPAVQHSSMMLEIHIFQQSSKSSIPWHCFHQSSMFARIHHVCQHSSTSAFQESNITAIEHVSIIVLQHCRIPVFQQPQSSGGGSKKHSIMSACEHSAQQQYKIPAHQHSSMSIMYHFFSLLERGVTEKKGKLCSI